MRMLPRELEHQNVSLKERLLVARNQLVGTASKPRREEPHSGIHMMTCRILSISQCKSHPLQQLTKLLHI